MTAVERVRQVLNQEGVQAVHITASEGMVADAGKRVFVVEEHRFTVAEVEEIRDNADNWFPQVKLTSFPNTSKKQGVTLRQGA